MSKKLNLQKLISYALSDSDLRNLLGSDIKIWNYPDLLDVFDVDDLFDDQGRCMILYDIQSEFSGHWTCAMKHEDDDTIEFFDPYGVKYDAEKKWMTRKQLQNLGETENYLTNLMNHGKHRGYTIVYNQNEFQKEAPGINTCGRHCATRLLHKDQTINQYKDMIQKSKMSPDEFVTIYTYNIIKK